MLKESLKDYKLILGSASARRQDLLKQMGLLFELRPSAVNEIYPEKLKGPEIADYLARLKANNLLTTLKHDEILITADTVVWHNEKSLAKPKNKEEALKMLHLLNNNSHEVITSVCLTTISSQQVAHTSTKVTFELLSAQEIDYYIDRFKPYDKAGAYGIQEWIGLIGIKSIKGSYANVVGLPTHLVYKMLLERVVCNGTNQNTND